MQPTHPIIVARLEGGEHAFWNVVPVCEFVEPQFRDLERVLSRLMFSLLLLPAFDDAIAMQPEQENEPRQEQALPDKRQNDDAECDEENEVTIREGGAARCVERNPESRRERNDTSNADESPGGRPTAKAGRGLASQARG